MRLVTWAIRILVFLLLLAFAIKNTDPVRLHFYFELVWQVPLIVLLLAFFAAGAVFGLAAVLGTQLRQRREIHRLKRELNKRAASERADSGERADSTPVAPPAVDA